MNPSVAVDLQAEIRGEKDAVLAKEFCAGSGTYKIRVLPEHHTDRIELIDRWNMTRTLLCEHAKGKTELSLPGKEGMAVLARAE